MEFIYHVGDIIEVTETYGCAAVYNKKGQIINSHVKDNVVKYNCEVLKVWTKRFYTGNGKYYEFQVSTMKYLNGSRINIINNHFELINSGNRSVKLHKRGDINSET